MKEPNVNRPSDRSESAESPTGAGSVRPRRRRRRRRRRRTGGGVERRQGPGRASPPRSPSPRPRARTTTTTRIRSRTGPPPTGRSPTGSSTTGCRRGGHRRGHRRAYERERPFVGGARGTTATDHRPSKRSDWNSRMRPKRVGRRYHSTAKLASPPVVPGSRRPPSESPRTWWTWRRTRPGARGG